jgi:hypothetical protein
MLRDQATWTHEDVDCVNSACRLLSCCALIRADWRPAAGGSSGDRPPCGDFGYPPAAAGSLDPVGQRVCTKTCEKPLTPTWTCSPAPCMAAEAGIAGQVLAQHRRIDQRPPVDRGWIGPVGWVGGGDAWVRLGADGGGVAGRRWCGRCSRPRRWWRRTGRRQGCRLVAWRSSSKLDAAVSRRPPRRRRCSRLRRHLPRRPTAQHAGQAGKSRRTWPGLAPAGMAGRQVRSSTKHRGQRETTSLRSRSSIETSMPRRPE